MTTWYLGIDFHTAMMFRVYQAFGMGFLFIPIQTLCYVGIPMEKNNNVSGMTNLARNLGGSIGIAAIGVIVSRRSQFHQKMLSQNATELNPAYLERLNGLAGTFQTLGHDVVTATQMAHQVLYGTLQRQAALLGYIDAMYIYGIVAAVMIPAAFLMKKSIGGVQRGGH